MYILDCRWKGSRALRDLLTMHFLMKFYELQTSITCCAWESAPFSYLPFPKLSPFPKTFSQCSSVKYQGLMPNNPWYSPGRQENELGTNSTCVSEPGISSRHQLQAVGRGAWACRDLSSAFLLCVSKYSWTRKLEPSWREKALSGRWKALSGIK